MPAPNSTRDLILRMADAIGGVIEFWGFKRHLGRAWAVLYFASEPLSATELAEHLALSSGAISMTMNELVKWGVARKSRRPGERRDYFEPETNIWKMVSRVFRERELAQIREAIDAFEDAITELSRQRAAAPALERSYIDFVIERVEGLLTLARIANNILCAILSGENVSALPIKNFPAG